MKVLIGTKNKGKIESAKKVFEMYYKNVEIESISVNSGVKEQPIGKETYIGARNRVENLIKYAKDNNIEADYYVAVESGLINELGFWAITNIAVIKNRLNEESVGTSASFPVPNKYVKDIKEHTLGTIMDKIFMENDLRSTTGGIGLLTHEKMTRIDLSTQAFMMALTTFINDDIWKD